MALLNFVLFALKSLLLNVPHQSQGYVSKTLSLAAEVCHVSTDKRREGVFQENTFP